MNNLDHDYRSHPDKISFLTPEQLADSQPGFTIHQLRWWLRFRKTNGLAQYVHKPGRVLLIDEQGFIQWLKEQPDC